MRAYRNWLQKKVKQLIPQYIHHRNYIARGNSEATTIRQITQVVLLAKIAYKEIPLWASVLLGASLIITFWTIGWIWDKNSGNEAEAEWGNRRNPFVKKLLKRKL